MDIAVRYILSLVAIVLSVSACTLGGRRRRESRQVASSWFGIVLVGVLMGAMQYLARTFGWWDTPEGSIYLIMLGYFIGISTSMAMGQAVGQALGGVSMGRAVGFVAGLGLISPSIAAYLLLLQR
jgi:hypothetical protein